MEANSLRQKQKRSCNSHRSAAHNRITILRGPPLKRQIIGMPTETALHSVEARLEGAPQQRWRNERRLRRQRGKLRHQSRRAGGQASAGRGRSKDTPRNAVGILMEASRVRCEFNISTSNLRRSSQGVERVIENELGSH